MGRNQNLLGTLLILIKEVLVNRVYIGLVYYDASMRDEQLKRFVKMNKGKRKEQEGFKRATSNLKDKKYFTKVWGKEMYN